MLNDAGHWSLHMSREKIKPIDDVGDSWSAFERAVDAAIKSGPKHKTAVAASDSIATPKKLGRPAKGSATKPSPKS
jgi:hypothetical protein